MSEKTIKSAGNRRLSRELALKGLYQQQMSGNATAAILANLQEEAEYARADQEYCKVLINGVLENLQGLDAKIGEFVDRKVSELSPIEHAILCIATYELAFLPDLPYRVAINEAIELAKRYGGADGHKYVNGVLDRLAANLRGEEFQPRKPAARKK